MDVGCSNPSRGGLPGGSERIPVGFGKVRLRIAFTALDGEILGNQRLWKEQGSLPGLVDAEDMVQFPSVDQTVEDTQYANSIESERC